MTLTAQGTAMATVVTPSANIINFGSIESGTQALRSMSLTNESDTPARYEFVNDALGVFSFGDAVRGVIPSLFTISVTIGFNPTAPSHHWKRVTLLVKNGEPLYVDLVGTAYSEKLRPPPLSNAHVEDYMRRVQEGGNPVRLEGTAPDSPSAKASQAQSRAQSAVPSMAPSEMLRAAVARPPSEGLSSWEQHFLGHDVSQPLAVDSQTVEFPACSRLRPADYKSVSVTNKTTAKLTIYPTVPGWQDPLAPPNAPPEEPVFKARPSTCPSSRAPPSPPPPSSPPQGPSGSRIFRVQGRTCPIAQMPFAPPGPAQLGQRSPPPRRCSLT